jgi:hypothetical protein
VIRSVKAHPGVFIGGMVTYAVVAHWLIPKYGSGMKSKATGK